MRLELYHNAPWFIKNIVVSAYGRKLYKRRYDNKYFKKMLAAVIERQNWGEDRLKDYQDEILRNLIRTAAQHVPYYRDLFQNLDIEPEVIRTTEDLADVFPILEKKTIRTGPERLVDERMNIKKLNKIYTSGTTGSPICIYRDDVADAYAYAFYEGRWRVPYGITKDSSWAMIGGKLIISQKQTTPPFWVWNSGLNQLYMSAYHLSADFAKSYLEELRKRKLDYIHGYASSLYSLASFAEKLGFDDIRFKVAISNAEPFYDYQREKIEKIFNCRAVDTYGSTEWCLQGCECAEGKMHLSTDAGVFEVVDSQGKPAGNGEVGDVVCTGLINFAQPLIRYRIGDSARLSTGKCHCGSSFPILESIEGRSDDLVILRDGRKVGRLDPVFKGGLPIIEAQICQNGLDDFVINLVPDKGWDERAKKALTRSFHNFLGKVNIDIVIVDSVPRTKNGKFKAVINNMKRKHN